MISTLFVHLGISYLPVVSSAILCQMEDELCPTQHDGLVHEVVKYFQDLNYPSRDTELLIQDS
jgi:hypothetical protein